jgi:hypothetical protein
MAVLHLNRGQVKKLLDAGLLVAVPGFSPVCITDDSVDRLRTWAARPPLPKPEGFRMAVVHLGPLDEANDTSGRPVWGYGANPPLNLSARDLLDAWTGFWGVSPDNADALVGGVMLGDVAGFVPPETGLRVTGWTSHPGLGVQFEGDPLTPQERALYTGRFIRARPGALWQWVD